MSCHKTFLDAFLLAWLLGFAAGLVVYRLTTKLVARHFFLDR